MNTRRPKTEAELAELLGAIDVRAPDRLHQSVQLLADERTRQRPGRRMSASSWGLAARLATAALVVVLLATLAITLGPSHGVSAGPSLEQTSALAVSAPMLPAPAASAAHRDQLAANVAGVHFPYWRDSLGWRATGARVDRARGRTVTTVFYANARGDRIGYSIVGGTPPPQGGAGTVVWRGGVRYRLVATGNLRLVAWERDGHLCVIAGRSVSGTELLRLASAEAS